MIEIKLQDLLNNISVLREIADKNLNGKSAFLLARILREVEKEYNTFQESREKLIQKYGEKDDNDQLITDENGNLKIPKDKIPDFNKNISELLDIYVQLNVTPIKLEDLEDIDFTVKQMMALESFIIE